MFLKILEKVVAEVSNRYSPFLSIAEAISSIVGKIKISPKNDKKTLIKKIVDSEPEPLPINKKPKVKEELKEKNKDLEEDLQEEDIDGNDDVVNVDYSHEEELLINDLYGSNPLDYVDLFYGGMTSNVLGNPYDTDGFDLSGAQNQFISDQEAEKIMVKIQYAASLRDFDNVSFRERDNFSHWMKFNSVLGKFYQAVHGMTDDVDYDKLF